MIGPANDSTLPRLDGIVFASARTVSHVPRATRVLMIPVPTRAYNTVKKTSSKKSHQQRSNSLLDDLQ